MDLGVIVDFGFPSCGLIESMDLGFGRELARW